KPKPRDEQDRPTALHSIKKCAEAKISLAEEYMEKALSNLREKLKREINNDVKTLKPALKKFELNVNRAKTQSQIVSDLYTFGKYLGSTSAKVLRRKDISIPVNNTSRRTGLTRGKSWVGSHVKQT
ncbi:unnamed protein product, partial [Meganyctiphanes norvegica]